MFSMLLPIKFLAFFSVICFVTVQAAKYDFPKVKSIPKVFSYPSTNGNVTYTDDYFWMEDTSDKNKDLQNWLKDQAILTQSYMRKCKDRKSIENDLREAYNYNDFEQVSQWGFQSGNLIYAYSLKKPGENRPTWYLATVDEFKAAKKNNMNPPAGKPFLNVSLLSSDNSVSVATITISPDAKTFGYLALDNTASSGTWYYRSIKSPLIKAKTTPKGGEGRLPLVIPYADIFSSLIWKSDSSGFFYAQTHDIEGGSSLDHAFKVKWHKVNTDYDQDVIVFDAHNLGENGNSSFLFFYLSTDDRWLIVSSYYTADNYVRTYATLLEHQTISNNMKWISLSPKNDFVMWPVQIIGDDYYFQTDHKAENTKVAKIRMDFSKAKQVKLFNQLKDRPKIIDVIAERKDASISNTGNNVFPIAHDKCIVIYTELGQKKLYLYDLLSGKKLQQILPQEKIAFPLVGGFPESKEGIITFSSFDTPDKVYEMNYVNGQIETSLVLVENIAGTKDGDFVFEQLYATSKDGTQVPYFVISKDGVPKDGSKYAYIYTYAAYGFADNLYYQFNYFVLFNRYDLFFVWCLARGGGDEGGSWYKSGRGIHKQNTIDDLIACSEDLVKRKYTSDGKILLEGQSASGMVVGSVINQAREGMIGAAYMESGLYDLFEFELRATLGQNNLIEFGDVNKNSEIQTVFNFSPYQNIDPKRVLPPILLQAGTNDDRIPPSIAYKYLAKLQSTHPTSPNPFLIHLTGIGHFASGSDTDESIIEAADAICLFEISAGLKSRN